MNINLELLVADLASKMHRGLLLPHSVNLEDDLRAAIRQAEQPEVSAVAGHMDSRAGVVLSAALSEVIRNPLVWCSNCEVNTVATAGDVCEPCKSKL